MNRLKDEILAQCTVDNCCFNELIFLPVKGDVGFEDYYEHKAALIRSKKLSFKKSSEDKLMLSYPLSDDKFADEKIFDMFFESANIVSGNHEFEGCFAIDITNYINKTNDPHFYKLLSYIYNNPNIVFLLFMYSDNVNDCENMYNFITQYIDIRKMRISLPDVDDLVNYTMSKIRDFVTHVERGTDELLKAFFSENSYGFDTADYIIRHLKASDYDGSLEKLNAKIEELKKTSFLKGRLSGFGY